MISTFMPQKKFRNFCITLDSATLEMLSHYAVEHGNMSRITAIRSVVAEYFRGKS